MAGVRNAARSAARPARAAAGPGLVAKRHRIRGWQAARAHRALVCRPPGPARAHSLEAGGEDGQGAAGLTHCQSTAGILATIAARSRLPMASGPVPLLAAVVILARMPGPMQRRASAHSSFCSIRTASARRMMASRSEKMPTTSVLRLGASILGRLSDAKGPVMRPFLKLTPVACGRLEWTLRRD